MLNKTIGEVVNEVLMLAAAKPGNSMLLVEGVDDVCFWSSRVVGICSIIYATGKKTAQAAVDRLNVIGFGKHVGVFDRDYDDIGEATNLARNRIFWDCHSVETVLFSSSAGDKVLAELFSQQDAAFVENQFGFSLKTTIWSVCERFGRLRYLHYLSSGENQAETTSLFRVFLPGMGHALPENMLHAEAFRCGAVPSAIQAKGKLDAVNGWEPSYLVRGHDIADLVHIFVREFGRSCAISKVEWGLRLGFERVDLEATSVYLELVNWERLHQPYKVVSAVPAYH